MDKSDQIKWDKASQALAQLDLPAPWEMQKEPLAGRPSWAYKEFGLTIKGHFAFDGFHTTGVNILIRDEQYVLRTHTFRLRSVGTYNLVGIRKAAAKMVEAKTRDHSLKQIRSQKVVENTALVQAAFPNMKVRLVQDSRGVTERDFVVLSRGDGCYAGLELRAEIVEGNEVSVNRITLVNLRHSPADVHNLLDEALKLVGGER